MTELRQDPTTREWVIMAPERAKRPQNRPKRRLVHEVPDWDESCPFCPGNESQTPPEAFRVPLTSQASAWAVRVVPNRFAALTTEGNIRRRGAGYFTRQMDGFGVPETFLTPNRGS